MIGAKITIRLESGYLVLFLLVFVLRGFDGVVKLNITAHDPYGACMIR